MNCSRDMQMTDTKTLSALFLDVQHFSLWVFGYKPRYWTKVLGRYRVDRQTDTVMKPCQHAKLVNLTHGWRGNRGAAEVRRERERERLWLSLFIKSNSLAQRLFSWDGQRFDLAVLIRPLLHTSLSTGCHGCLPLIEMYPYNCWQDLLLWNLKPVRLFQLSLTFTRVVEIDPGRPACSGC